MMKKNSHTPQDRFIDEKKLSSVAELFTEESFIFHFKDEGKGKK